MGFTPPFTAIHHGGTCEHFSTIEELHALRRQFGAKHRQGHVSWDGTLAFTVNDWIVRDAMGATVLPDDVPHPARRRASWACRADRARAAMERGLPIPGCGRRGSYGWHRRFAFAGDNRAASAIEADLAGDLGMLESRHMAHLRKARLIDGWDGPNRSSERCWKDQRATRWK